MTSTRDRFRRLRRRPVLAAALALAAALGLGGGLLLAGGASAPGSAVPGRTAAPGQPDFGPDTYVFSPGLPQSQIEARVNSIASQQAGNEFGAQRYALLFEPGTYGSAVDPLFLQVGYYTSVAGLGTTPGAVVINGAVDSFNQCSAGTCTALNNFWRSLSNLTINVPAPPNGAPCQQTAEFWAASQASPVRRVEVNGFTSLEDYCSKPGYSSGGFIADSVFSGHSVLNGSQQQFLVRNSSLDGWSNGVWNQVFSGDVGAPAQDFGAGGQYTTLAASPVTEEAPFLRVDSGGNYSVFVPAVRHGSAGPSWASGPTPGTALPIQRFYIATPGDPASVINAALARGQDLILTPGVYNLNQTIQVTQPDTVVLGLGFATLVPENGIAAMRVASVPGVKLSGMIVAAAGELPGAPAGGQPARGGGPGRPHRGAGRVLPPRRRRAGPGDDQPGGRQLPGDPRRHLGVAGRPRPRGRLDRQHRGHRRRRQRRPRHRLRAVRRALRKGRGDLERDERHGHLLPERDAVRPPSQAAWSAGTATDGYPAFLITHAAADFHGYGMGSYSFFDRGLPI